MRRTLFVPIAFSSALASLAACGSDAGSNGGNDITPTNYDNGDGGGTGNDAGNVPLDGSSRGDGGASVDGSTANDAATTNDDGAAPVDGSTAKDGGNGNWVVGPHPALPQITQSGGPVLTNPKVMPVYFDGYAYANQVADLAATLGSQPFWGAATHEYGVGALTGRPAVQIHETPAATISDAQIQSWLQSKLTGANPALGAPDSQTIYTIFYPTATTVTQQNAKSCEQFGGYHSSVSVNGTDVPYAVIPQCAELNGQSGVDVVTVATSHEWIEAATDPYPLSNGAYNGIDDDHVAFRVAFGGVENGDMCAEAEQNYDFLGAYAHKLQRGWSNAAALGDLDPCQPTFGPQPYFNAAPVMNDSVTAYVGGFIPTTTKGVQIAGVGQSKTVPVQVWSLADVGDITLVAIDVTSVLGGNGASPLLSFAWDKTTVHNGDTAQLTITLKKAPGFGQNAAFLVESKVGPADDAGKQHVRNFWAGIVSQ